LVVKAFLAGQMRYNRVMGQFEARVKIGILKDGFPHFTEEANLLVDTGAMYSLIPAEVLERAGVRRLGNVPVKLANGARAEKSFGMAVLEVEGHPVATNVLFGEGDDLALLGMTTLELASLAVDPENQRLVPVAAIQAFDSRR